VHRAFRNRLLFAWVLLAFSLAPALAFAGQPDRPCPASAGHLCSLNNYLHGLDAIAVVLAVILVVVIVATIAYFRKARRMKLEP
jgi:hypothetical protein